MSCSPRLTSNKSGIANISFPVSVDPRVLKRLNILLQTSPVPLDLSVAYMTTGHGVACSIPRLAKIFPGIDDIHFARIHSFLTASHCFDDGYVGKDPMAWEEYCAEKWP